MGNYRFKLSDMIPNAWFYKLRDMNKSSRKHKSATPPPSHHHHQSNKKIQQPSTTSNSSKPKQQFINTTPRKSYYFTREHISRTTTTSPQKPRKSSSKHRTAATTPSSSEFQAAEPEFRADRVLHTDSNSNSNSKSSSMDDIIIDVDNNSISTTKSHINSTNNKHLFLPPILTKPRNNQHKNKNSTTTPPCSRRFSVSSAAGVRRLRIKINSPRVSGENFRKLHQANTSVSNGRRGRITASSAAAATGASALRKKKLPDSFAIVKSSLNPQRDFRESMVEMIVENNIRSSKELEDLLACYLTLNSDEYHGLIINVFKQIWFDLNLTDNSNNNNMYQQQEE